MYAIRSYYGHRVHAQAARVLRVRAADAAAELLELELHVPLVETGDGRCQRRGVAPARVAVALLAEGEERLASRVVLGLSGAERSYNFV